MPCSRSYPGAPTSVQSKSGNVIHKTPSVFSCSNTVSDGDLREAAHKNHDRGEFTCTAEDELRH